MLFSQSCAFTHRPSSISPSVTFSKDNKLIFQNFHEIYKYKKYFNKNSNTVRINDVYLCSKETKISQCINTIWRIQAREGSVPLPEQIIYGNTINGFDTIIPPKPLVDGVLYQLFVINDSGIIITELFTYDKMTETIRID